MSSKGAVPIEQIAVWATSTRAPADAPDAQRSIRVFCWPEVGKAWVRLGEAIAAAGQRFGHRVPDSGQCWMEGPAPQLRASLHGDGIIAEATLGALVQRLPIRLTLARVDHKPGSPSNLGQRCRSLFGECMGPYAAYLKKTNQTARAAALSADVDGQTRTAQAAAFTAIHSLVEEGGRLGAMRLRYWTDGPPPLPLELAQVMAEGVARHLDDPERPSPLWEAMRAKLVGHVRWVGASGRRRK